MFSRFTETSFNLPTNCSDLNTDDQNANTVTTTKSLESTGMQDDRTLKNIFIQRQGSFSELSIKKKKKQSTVQKFDLNNCHLTKSTINNFKKNKKAFRTLLFVSCSIIILWAPWIILWPVEAYCFAIKKPCIPKVIYAISYLLGIIISTLVILNKLNMISIFRIFKFTNESINFDYWQSTFQRKVQIII